MKNLKKGTEIIEKLNSAGFKAYFVGGCVRDVLMKRPPSDIDIATSAPPEKVKSLFEKTADTGLKHGTITVIIDKTPFEVTTFRVESEYEEHRRPKKVEFVSDIKEDLSRRDFTINAMAYHLGEGLIDLFSGKNDLEKKIIRCVGDAKKRFEEDALRMLRCVRFCCTLDFDAEEKTVEAIKEKAELIRFVSVERIYAEFLKSIMSDNPQKFILAKETGLLKYIMPELSDSDGLSDALRAVNFAKKERVVRLCVLLQIVPNSAKEILDRLKVENHTKESVLTVIFLEKFSKKSQKIEIKKAILKVGKQNFEVYLDLMEANAKAGTFGVETKDFFHVKNLYDEIVNNNEPIFVKDLKISGKDVMNMGFSGKDVGKVLSELQKEVMEHPERNTKEYLTERLTQK